jgi:hypothetical protein
MSKTSLPEWLAGYGDATATPAPLFNGPYELRRGVTIKSHKTNAGWILVSRSGVTVASFILTGGEQVEIPTDDLSKVFVASGGIDDQLFSFIAA